MARSPRPSPRGGHANPADDDGPPPLDDPAALEKYESLLKATSAGNLEAVKRLHRDNDRSVDAKGRTPLHIAAYNDFIVIAQFLVEKSPSDVKSKDNEGWTPLHSAAETNSLLVVRFLVEQCKANVEARRDDGGTPLHCAAYNNCLEVMRYLVEEAKANINAKCNAGVHRACQDGATPLNFARRAANTDACTYLERKEAERVRDLVGLTATLPRSTFANTTIHPATGSAPITSTTQTDNEGNTELHTAATGGREKWVSTLIDDEGADVNAKNNVEDTPLHCAARGGHFNVVQALKQRGAQTNLKNRKGETPKMVAIGGGHFHLKVELG
eukprot:Selendium_serpulae@DN6502_c2_g1_i4.p1